MKKNGRGVGGKRCVRRSVSITNNSDDKLEKLAISCCMTKAELMAYIVERTLNSPEAVTNLQKHFNKDQKYWVYPTKVNGETYYS